MRRKCTHQQRVAVRLGLGNFSSADIAACAAPVFNDDLAADLVAQVFSHNAANHIRGATRRIGNDQAYRLIRIRVGPGIRKRRKCQNTAQQQTGGRAGHPGVKFRFKHSLSPDYCHGLFSLPVRAWGWAWAYP